MKEKTVCHDGDKWKVLGMGVNDGNRVYCHLASTSLFRSQKNGQNPVQIADWVPCSALSGAQFTLPPVMNACDEW